jgi:hypothetical protein
MEYQIEQELGMEMKYPIQQESGMEQEEGEEPVDDDDEESDIRRLGHREPPDYFSARSVRCIRRHRCQKNNPSFSVAIFRICHGISSGPCKRRRLATAA